MSSETRIRPALELDVPAMFAVLKTANMSGASLGFAVTASFRRRRPRPR